MVNAVVIVSEAGEFTFNVESLGQTYIVTTGFYVAYLMAESESRAMESPATP